MIRIVVETLGLIAKGFIKGDLEDLEIRGQDETIQITALIKSGKIPRRVLKNCGDLLSLNLQWKKSANVGVKNSQVSKIIIMINTAVSVWATDDR